MTYVYIYIENFIILFYFFGVTTHCGFVFHSPLADFSLLFRGFVITHNDTPQSVGLLRTSDQLVAIYRKYIQQISKICGSESWVGLSVMCRYLRGQRPLSAAWLCWCPLCWWVGSIKIFVGQETCEETKFVCSPHTPLVPQIS